MDPYAKKIPLKDGDEYDMLTAWRRFYRHRAGTARRVKNRYNRRLRRAGRAVDRWE